MATPRRPEKVSDEERVEPKLDSVYDFIYVDYRRIGLFLSQFDDSGLLQQLEQSEAVTEGTDNTGDRSVGVNVGVFSGKSGSGRKTTEGRSESSKRVYDPLWTNVLTFLDFLQERDLLRRDIKAARIGQIGLFSGSLTIVNASLLKTVLQSSFVREQFTTQQIAVLTQQHAALVKTNQLAMATPAPTPEMIRTNVNGNLDTICTIPIVNYGKSVVGEHTIWYPLSDEFVVGSIGDLILKHSTNVSGKWHIVGVVDAVPDEFVPLSIDAFLATPIKSLEQFVKGLARVSRTILGRPATAYGVTPIVIFRQIAD
jgi:hypothetical protein